MYNSLISSKLRYSLWVFAHGTPIALRAGQISGPPPLVQGTAPTEAG
jgi:hypothetical protein